MVMRGAPQCWRKRGVRPDSPGDLSLEEGCEVPLDLMLILDSNSKFKNLF